MAVELPRRRFTVDEYHRMAEVGILSDDERIELLEGEIVRMSPIGMPHAGTTDRIAQLFWSRLAGRAIVRVQGPVPLPAQLSQPQPDVTLLRPERDFYTKVRPEPPDVLLIVEVMDTSVERDRCVKLPLYARAGISETWLLNLPESVVEVYRDPNPDGYRTSRLLRRGDTLSIAAFPDVSLTVDDVLG